MKSIDVLKKVDLNIARKVSLNEALEYLILPICSQKEEIYVATSSKEQKSEELLHFIFNKKINYVEVNEDSLIQLIRTLLDYKNDELEISIIKEAIINKASDIHFEPVDDELKIRMRINGILVLKRRYKLTDYHPILSRLKIKSNMDITEKRIPQDGKMNIIVDNIKYNLRLSTIPIIAGEKIVIRILYEDKYLSSLENLNFQEKQLKNLRKIMKIKHGLILINGPTGVGKSTTLYSILNSIKDEDINITTLEDPIEINLNGINQISLNPKIGITFASGLRSILRQDPDVIMVGEIRDEETAKMAVRAAITGHKVYSTIHTKNPREVYSRLEEMGVQPYLIKDSLIGIISQRLIKVLCDNCKIKIKTIKKDGHKINLYKKGSCKCCNETGYIGRRLVASVNYVNGEIIRESNSIKDRKDLLNNDEMIEVLLELLEEELIDYYDFLEFIEGEELLEANIQKFRDYL